MSLVSKLHQRVHSVPDANNDTAAMPTITTAWPATWHVLLATKRHAAIATGPSHGLYLNAINKHENYFFFNSAMGLEITTLNVKANKTASIN